MSSREMFDLEPGDTGEALLPAPHSDRDASESPTAPLAEANKVNGKGAHADLVETLRELARDAKIRGDVGKEGGVEAWDYLNLHADKIERGES